jgi:hypothetical protein
MRASGWRFVVDKENLLVDKENLVVDKEKLSLMRLLKTRRR